MSVISPSAERFARENIEKQRRFDLERMRDDREIKVSDLCDVVESLNKRDWSEKDGWSRPMTDDELQQAYYRARKAIAEARTRPPAMKWHQFSDGKANAGSDRPAGDSLPFAKTGPTQVWKLPPWKTSP